jgi:hypothetical protein
MNRIHLVSNRRRHHAVAANHHRRHSPSLWSGTILTFLFLLLACCPQQIYGGMLDEYFYIQNLQSKERHHVKEHLATAGDKPDFLYSTNYPHARVVEFYAQ